ncbi:phosphodiester glycosidase family protein [Aeromicrobium ponti]|uniref:Ig-like protein group 2 n=1 Tax=Cytobacillus oceanisediminis TaxID=665099 RepID=A0A562K3D1_9BACI|nr:phosphodiester glycosidase family protein [Cytobacillus oceanisediminis]TWH89725.1 Ig-like protein group 2 [Cytobacillus oceanisediminis]
MKKAIMSAVVCFLCLQSLFGSAASADSTVNLTPGVKLEKKNTIVSNKKQSISILNVNLLDPYTTVGYGISSPITQLAPVTSLAKMNTFEKHHVVGAVNASFFHIENGNPAYLLASNNKIESLGALSALDNGFMHTPAAFGVNKDGKALIDKFHLNITLTHHNRTYQLDSFNRQRNPNESILFTSSFRFGNTRTNETGLEIVVRNLNRNLDPGASFGDEISGTVAAIRPYGTVSSSIIPKDGFVISAHGTKVDQIRDLKIGDPLSVKIDTDEKWRNSNFMLASGPLLVQKGKLDMTIDPSSPRAAYREPRTAVAVDSTGTKVFYVTVDGRMPGFSEGMTLKEFAGYLASLGAYQALNLDGGGSTTMAVRYPGNRYAALVNKPSDGRQRSVSAILQAISTAPYGQAVAFKAQQAVEGKIAIGASVSFKITDALDSYNNLIPIKAEEVQYSTDGTIGKIEDGNFIALKEGQTNVTIKYGKAQVKVPVTVAGAPHRFEVSPESLYIQKGDQQQLTVKAYDEAGKPLVFNSSNIKWSISGEAGTVSQTGLFTAASSEKSGVITAELGTGKAAVPVTVSNKPKLISRFDNPAAWKAESIRAKTSLGVSGDSNQKEGTASLKLSYDFTGNQSGTAASYAVSSKRIALSGKPKAIGMWVYGDGQAHWLRGRLYDAAGKEWTVNFTEDGKLNWKGWKYVQADIPAGVSYPISLDRVYITEPNVSNQDKGTLYLDDLQAVYELPHHEKYFTADVHAKTVKPDKVWNIKFNTALNPASFTNENIYIQDENGVRQAVSVKINADLKSAAVGAPSSGYASGKSYQLVVTKYVRSIMGIPFRKDFSMSFKVQ